MLHLPMNLCRTPVLLGGVRHLSGPGFYSAATISSCANTEVSKTSPE